MGKRQCAGATEPHVLIAIRNILKMSLTTSYRFGAPTSAGLSE